MPLSEYVFLRADGRLGSQVVLSRDSILELMGLVANRVRAVPKSLGSDNDTSSLAYFNTTN